MIARPALAAVTEALDGVTDPREAVEILVARDLWPTDGPTVTTVRALAAYASLGVPAVLALRGMLREYAAAFVVDAEGAWDAGPIGGQNAPVSGPNAILRTAWETYGVDFYVGAESRSRQFVSWAHLYTDAE